MSLYVVRGLYKNSFAGSYAKDTFQARQFVRTEREMMGMGLGNPLLFSSAYEFPATYVYGFRDRFASREIGLSTYCNSPSAPPGRRIRTRAQDCLASNYVFFYQVRETSGTKESDFCEDRVVQPNNYVLYFLSCIFFYRKRDSLYIFLRIYENSILFIIHDKINFYRLITL